MNRSYKSTLESLLMKILQHDFIKGNDHWHILANVNAAHVKMDKMHNRAVAVYVPSAGKIMDIRELLAYYNDAISIIDKLQE